MQEVWWAYKRRLLTLPELLNMSNQENEVFEEQIEKVYQETYQQEQEDKSRWEKEIHDIEWKLKYI